MPVGAELAGVLHRAIVERPFAEERSLRIQHHDSRRVRSAMRRLPASSTCRSPPTLKPLVSVHVATRLPSGANLRMRPLALWQRIRSHARRRRCPTVRRSGVPRRSRCSTCRRGSPRSSTSGCSWRGRRSRTRTRPHPRRYPRQCRPGRCCQGPEESTTGVVHRHAAVEAQYEDLAPPHSPPPLRGYRRESPGARFRRARIDAAWSSDHPQRARRHWEPALCQSEGGTWLRPSARSGVRARV